MSYLDIANNVVKRLEADNKSDQLSSIADIAVRDIVKSKKWNASPETLRLEDEADTIQRKVMAGRCKVIDYQEAVRRWKSAGIR